MRAQSGMTLLEVLVALMVLALTGLLLAEGLSFGTRVWDRAGAAAEATMLRFDAARTVRRLIEQAQPGLADGDLGAFSGDTRTLSFVSVGAARLAGGRSRRIELSQANPGDAVVLRIVDPDGVEPEERLRLFEHMSSLSLRYFGHNADRTANAWTDHWTDGVILPLLVELRLKGSEGTAPMIVTVAPRKRFPVDCMVFVQRSCTGTKR